MDALRLECEKTAARLQILADASSEGILIIDAGVVLDCNDAFARIFGYSPSETVGKRPLEFFEQSVRTQAMADFGLGVGIAAETIGLRSNGTTFPVEFRHENRTFGGRQLRVLHVRDLSGVAPPNTGLRENERSARRRSHLLDLAVVSARDLDHRITLWTSGAQEFYGYTANETIGRILPDLFKAEYPAPLDDLLAEAIRTGFWNGRVRRHRKDGSLVVVQAHWTLERNEAGEPEAILEVDNDVTEQVRSEDRLATITNSLPFLIGYVTAAQTYGFVNGAYEAWFGEKAQAIRGWTLRSLLGEDGYEKVLPYVESALQGHSVEFAGEFQYPTGPKAVRGTYVPDIAAGEVRGFYVLIEDLTHLKRAEEDRRRYQAQLEAIFEQATVGHITERSGRNFHAGK